MTYIILLWSCSLSQPLCSHPDATWSGVEYVADDIAAAHGNLETKHFERANPTRRVIKFEVMSKERYEFEKGNYQCSQMGAGE